MKKKHPRDFIEYLMAISFSDGKEGKARTLESILGDHRARPHHWLERLVDQGKAVARIDFKDGRSNGTGFLVTANDLGFNELGDEKLLVTGSHILCDPEKPGATDWLKDQVHPSRMTIIFTGMDPNCNFTPEVIWQSPVDQLDVCIARLKPEHPIDWSLPTMRIAANAPNLNIPLSSGGQRKTRVFIWGYPSGRALSVTLENNKFQGITGFRVSAKRIIRYDAPTEPGNSGGPVLDESLEVIGIHQAGVVKASKTNQGTWIGSVLRAIKKR